MSFVRCITILAFVSVTCIAICTADKENNKSNHETASTSPPLTSTSSTTIPTSTVKVAHRPVKEPGCYWTPCKSPLTYDQKCPPETQEQNENDEMPCEGIFLSYQCCPKKDVEVITTDKPVVGATDKMISE